MDRCELNFWRIDTDFQLLSNAKFPKIKLAKWSFAAKRVEHIVSADGIVPDDKEVQST